MGFESLLGNERLKENLTGSLLRGHTAHFYLIAGPEGSGRHTLARLLAAALLCTGQDRPCLHCLPCRKVLSDNHPDFITVDDPEKKTVPVELIRQARADMYVMPNESDRKIYLFPRAQDMGIPGQNALLKVLEEPPEYGVFLLITDNPEKLLPTVRSRCVELKLSPLPEQLLLQTLRQRFPQAEEERLHYAAVRSGGYLGQGMTCLQQEDSPGVTAFGEYLLSGDPLELTRLLVPMERWKRDQLIPELESWVQLLHGAMLSRSGLPADSPRTARIGARCPGQRLSRMICLLQQAVRYARGNVSVAAICGWLQWELR